MIEWILQVDGRNMLQVHYSSGYNRYIFPDRVEELKAIYKRRFGAHLPRQANL
jgi:hypothetical protein